MNISKISETVINFFFPNICVVCGEDANKVNPFVCQTCLDKIEYIKFPYCLTCFQPLPDGGAHCWQCRKTKYHFDKIITVGKYCSILRELILKFKEKDFLKVVLGNLLLDTIKKNIDVNLIDYFISVPLSTKREFERGYNQSQLLVEFISNKLNKEVIKKNLIRIKDTKPQFELSRAERLVNLKDVFIVKEPALLKEKNIVLVDDIVTTCSTFEECSKVLKRTGVRKVYGLALARD
ncbi:MAG: ComF family protein [Elusimicrobia bacterium]|nr:ComF family protein [Elusimicrobiota bacterium]